MSFVEHYNSGAIMRVLGMSPRLTSIRGVTLSYSICGTAYAAGLRLLRL